MHRINPDFVSKRDYPECPSCGEDMHFVSDRKNPHLKCVKCDKVINSPMEYMATDAFKKILVEEEESLRDDKITNRVKLMDYLTVENVENIDELKDVEPPESQAEALHDLLKKQYKESLKRGK